MLDAGEPHRPSSASVVTGARPQRDRYGLSTSSSAPCEATNSSDSHIWTASRTASTWLVVRLWSNPRETSVASRTLARSGEGDPGSTQARMIRSPVRVLVTPDPVPMTVAAALRAPQRLEQIVQPWGRRKAQFGMEKRTVPPELAYRL
jgi:hypothetical protein